MRQRPAPETIQAGLNQVAPRFAGARNAVHLPDESEIGLAVEGAEHAFHAATQTVNGARRRATTDAYFRREYHVIASGGSSGHRWVFIYDWEGWKFVSLARSRMSEMTQR